jgi:hypothetical protein
MVFHPLSHAALGLRVFGIFAEEKSGRGGRVKSENF